MRFQKILFTAIAAFGLSLVAHGQAYYTNPATQVPPYQYNSNLPTPLQPSRTLANQYASGTLAGIAVTSGGGLETNTFSTNIFSQPPFVVVTQFGTVTTTTNVVTSVTTSNFVYSAGVTGVTNMWEATGH